jgi:hypothetical protein
MKTETDVISPFFTRNDAAKYLGITTVTLDKLNIPKIRIRRKVLIAKKTIDMWIAGHTYTKDETGGAA